MTKPPIHWMGSKIIVLDWLLSQFPETNEFDRFVDVFGGSGAVSMNVSCNDIIYNDVNKDLVAFFRVLRSEKRDKLLEQLELTMFGREELMEAGASDVGIDDIERARRFFVRVHQTIFGLEVRKGAWAVTKKPARKNMASIFANAVDKLPLYHSIVRGWHIECLDALKAIERYDFKGAFLYIDPPYPNWVREDNGEGANSNHYIHENDDEFHEKLALRLNKCVSLVAVSSYQSDKYDMFYPAPKWVKAVCKEHISNINKKVRQEVLWMNYKPKKQVELFSQSC